MPIGRGRPGVYEAYLSDTAANDKLTFGASIMMQMERALLRTLSQSRLEPYVRQSQGDFALAIQMYEQNLSASEAFHSSLHSVEIALRNVVDGAMVDHFGADWFKNDDVLKPDSLDEISKARAKLQKVAEDRLHGSLVAELSFGFWVGLLGPRYDEQLWRRELHRGFSSGGRKLRRTDVHSRFNMIRRFRNRVAHHEPIWDKDLIGLHREILEAVGWMCPVTANWTAALSRVPAVVGTRS